MTKNPDLWFKTRFAMKATLERFPVEPGNSFRPVSDADIHGLGELMVSAYRGGVDSESESLDEAKAEVQGTLSGKYGKLIPSASLVAVENDRLVSAVIFVWFEREKMPLMAYAMTHAEFKGRGLATKLIKSGLNRLLEAGFSECRLTVSEGNEPARTIYQRLGFRDILKTRIAKGEQLKDPTLRGLVGKLLTELKCHTVVLHSSRTQGNAIEQSDCHLVGFTKDGEEAREIRLLEGKYADASVYPEKRGVEDTSAFLRLRGGIVLYEENDFGTNLMLRIEAL